MKEGWLIYILWIDISLSNEGATDVVRDDGVFSILRGLGVVQYELDDGKGLNEEWLIVCSQIECGCWTWRWRPILKTIIIML